MKIPWPMIALCLVAGCERQSPTIMLPPDYKTVFSKDYADVTIYLDTAYIAPVFDELPSEKDFDTAHDVIMRHLNTVGRATEETSGADFTSIDTSSREDRSTSYRNFTLLRLSLH